MTGIPPGVFGAAEVLKLKSAARLGRAAAVVLALACSGCMVGPDYQSPPAPAAVKFLEANQPSVDTKTQEYEAWWRVFHDPVLDRLIKIAYDQNLSLVAAGTRVLQARAELGVAIGEFYPQTQHGDGSMHLHPGEPR